MRDINRIFKIEELFENKSNIREYLIFIIDNGVGNSIPTHKLEEFVEYTRDGIFDNRKEFFEFWKENPDLRLSQALITDGLIVNFRGVWFYLEDEEFIKYLETKKILPPKG